MNKRNIIKKILKASPESVYNKLISFIKKNIDSGTQIYTIKNGYSKGVRIILPKKIPKSYASMIEGNYEDFLVESITKNIDPTNKTIWDIGAHIGYQTFAFASIVKENGTVVSFEPNKNNIDTLRKNLELNKELNERIILRTEAISDINGTTTFNISRDKNDSTTSGGYMNEVTPPLPDSSYSSFFKSEVQTKTIDTLVEVNKLPEPDIIKIDVEGAEHKVLLGAQKFIERKKPILIIEIHTIPMMHFVEDFLIKHSYKISLLDDERAVFTKNIIAISK